MRYLQIYDYKQLANTIHNSAAHRKLTYAVLFYDDVIALMRELMKFNDINIGYIEVNSPDYNGYYKEYYVALDGDMELSIEAAWHASGDNHFVGYLEYDADVVLIDGDANSSILRKKQNADIFEVIWMMDDRSEDYGVVLEVDSEEDDHCDGIQNCHTKCDAVHCPILKQFVQAINSPARE